MMLAIISSWGNDADRAVCVFSLDASARGTGKLVNIKYESCVEIVQLLRMTFVQHICYSWAKS